MPKVDDGTALRQAERIRAATDFAHTAQVFAAMGNDTRLRILQLLSERGPLTAAELRVSLPGGDISPHLRTLINAGLIERTGHQKRSGAPVIFALADDAFAAIIFLLR